MPADGLPDLKTYLEGRFNIDGQDKLFDVAQEILATLRRTDFSALDRDELDVLDLLASSLMGTINAELLRRDGWTLKPGWVPASGSPSQELVEVDHAYTLVNEEEERWLYVSEPYAQEGERLRDLEELVNQGWDVDVRAGLALHYPGHTLRIQIERAGAITEPEKQRTRGLPRPT